MNRIPGRLVFVLAAVWLLAGPLRAADGAAAPAVSVRPMADRVRVELRGELLTEYVFKDAPRPYCHPLLGPGGLPMTRDWPMRDTPGEEHDHPHHRSLWFAHGAVNGIDFWADGPNRGKIVHEKFTELRSGEDFGTIAAENAWRSPAGQVVCRDTRRLRFYPPGEQGERRIDFEIALHAADGELRLGDTKEGTMAVRVAESMRLKGGLGKGRIVNSNGELDGQTWGKRADWCDYSGPVRDATVGIAMFDHPDNPRHPTWWHVRDYGLFAANPFGQHDFEKLADKQAGDLVVPAGKSVTFRYRLVLHRGTAGEARVAELYQAYVQGK